MNLFEQLVARLEALLAIVRDDSNDQTVLPTATVPTAPAEPNRPDGRIGVAVLSPYAADTINPCPICGQRCDFEACVCIDGCIGDGDHLRRLMENGPGPQ